jgi:EmrB/QacA subfamily drug resistance transporter
VNHRASDDIRTFRIPRAEWLPDNIRKASIMNQINRSEDFHPVKAVHVAEAPKRRRGNASPPLVLAIVCVGICLANLDLFIVNVALPNIGRDFKGSSLEDLSWVLNGYAIAYAALLVFFGRLAERYRRNLSFLLGVGLFTAASAACSISNNVETLIAFRVLQAAGAALMTPTSLGLLMAVFPPERRSTAVRTWTAIGGLAAALGPVIGGLLVTVNWRWIFLVNVPIGVIAMLIGWWKLPTIQGHAAPRPNPGDAALVTGGIGALTFAIVKVNDWGWGSPGIAGSTVAATILLALFVWRCFRLPNPFVDPALFRIRPFAGAALVMAPYSAAFGAMLLSVALWEQTAWGWSALQTGLAIAPGPLLVPITSLLLAGRLIARFGAAAVVTAGVFFFVTGLVIWASLIGQQPNTLLVIVGMIATGIGVGLTFPTLMGVGAGGLPPSAFATGSGVINMIRQAALAVGVAIFVAIVGSPASPLERVAAFHRGWWIMAGIAALSLIPNYIFIRARK